MLWALLALLLLLEDLLEVEVAPGVPVALYVVSEGRGHVQAGSGSRLSWRSAVERTCPKRTQVSLGVLAWPRRTYAPSYMDILEEGEIREREEKRKGYVSVAASSADWGLRFDFTFTPRLVRAFASRLHPSKRR